MFTTKCFTSPFEVLTLNNLIGMINSDFSSTVILCLTVMFPFFLVIGLIIHTSIYDLLNHKGEHGSDITHKLPEFKKPNLGINLVWLLTANGTAFVYNKWDSTGFSISGLGLQVGQSTHLGKRGYMLPANNIATNGYVVLVQASVLQVQSTEAVSGPILTNGLPIHKQLPTGQSFSQRVSQPQFYTLHVTKDAL